MTRNSRYKLAQNQREQGEQGNGLTLVTLFIMLAEVGSQN
jgi:hypothetical protein